jgi:hypothetical protein
VVTETTEGIAWAITGGKSGKEIAGDSFSEGSVQSGLVCWVELSGCGGLDVGGENIEQALIVNVSVINIRATRIYTIFLAIFAVAYYIIAISFTKNLRLDSGTE